MENPKQKINMFMPESFVSINVIFVDVVIDLSSDKV